MDLRQEDNAGESLAAPKNPIALSSFGLVFRPFGIAVFISAAGFIFHYNALGLDKTLVGSHNALKYELTSLTL